MKVRHIFESIWLVRVPIVSLFALGLVGLAASGGARSMLGGLFDQEGDALGLFFVDTTAFLVAATCVNAINMVLHLGALRFGLRSLRQPTPRVQLWVFGAAMVFPIVLISEVCGLTPGFGWLPKVGLGMAGFAVTMFLVLGAKVAQMYLTDSTVTTAPPPFLVFPASYVPPLNHLLLGLYGGAPGGMWPGIKGFLSGAGQKVFGIVAASGEGYFIPGAPGLVLESAQVFTTVLTLFSLAVYLVLGVFGHNRGVPVPALAYVLLFQMVATWVLAGLCFFFDRFRVPVLLVAFLLTRVTSNSPQADHLVAARPLQPGYAFPTPAEVLARYPSAPILVATAGGGIQAAAWTTTVMAGMEERCQCNLASRLAVFSAVSGGSVGAMNIGSVWPHLSLAKPLSRQPSLNAIAWGLVNPDVAAALLPAFHDKFQDRGRALEASWEAETAEGKRIELADTYLQDWSRKIGAGMPAFLFNSTNVESGAPVVFATSTFPVSHGGIVDETRRARSFHDIYGTDLRVATAVRLSATFPYVSPAARPYIRTLKEETFHFVDGGYYDNYGIYSLLAWLEAALDPPAKRPAALAIVRVLAFPKDGPAEGSTEGWGYQAGAPLDAFLSTRGTGQLVESDTVLERFAERLRSDRMTVELIDFRYPTMSDPDCATPPLSWKLTMAQQSCLDTAWKDPGVQAKADKLIEFLKSH